MYLDTLAVQSRTSRSMFSSFCIDSWVGLGPDFQKVLSFLAWSIVFKAQAGWWVVFNEQVIVTIEVLPNGTPALSELRGILMHVLGLGITSVY